MKIETCDNCESFVYVSYLPTADKGMIMFCCPMCEYLNYVYDDNFLTGDEADNRIEFDNHERIKLNESI